MRKRREHVSKEENRHTRSSSTLLDNSELMPVDVFEEIFWRLSTKTIARCRCVSKLWSSNLDRPDFTDLFLKNYLDCRHLLFAFKLNGKWFFFSSPQPQNPEENLSLLATNHRMCFRTKPGSCRINVPVRGLLCTTSIWLKDTIVCFDVMSEKFTYIENALENKTKWCRTMMNYTNKLGVMRLDDNGFFSGTTASLELWILDDVEKNKWLRKIYVLPPLWKILAADTRLKFVGMTSNGEIVFSPLGLVDPFYIFYYNVDKNTVVRVRIQGIGPVSGQDIYTFVDHVEDVKRINVSA